MCYIKGQYPNLKKGKEEEMYKDGHILLDVGNLKDSVAKYDFYTKDHLLVCDRYGEKWREFLGDNAIGELFMFACELWQVSNDLSTTCGAIKQRICFIGLPSEPMVSENNPNWVKEIALLEAALAKASKLGLRIIPP